MPRTDDSTAYAANWRTVLVADAAVGLIASVAGVALALVFTVVGGMALVAGGAWYSALVAQRARRWARLRRARGL